MTFGVKVIAPLLPEFLEMFPEVSVDLHFSDATVDLIGEGFDAGVRIAQLPDSSLIARRLCPMPRYTVASPSYLKAHGRPTHPMHLAQHQCFGYAYLSTPGVWHYTNAAGEQATVRPAGQFRVNNGEALLPSVIAGLGIADLPDFIVGDAIASEEGRGHPERLEPARRRRASGHPARRAAARARRSAGGIFDEAVREDEAEIAARRLLHPPLEGAGRLTWSVAECETGRGGGLSTRSLLDVEGPSPRPAARCTRVDPHPQGAGRIVPYRQT